MDVPGVPEGPPDVPVPEPPAQKAAKSGLLALRDQFASLATEKNSPKLGAAAHVGQADDVSRSASGRLLAAGTGGSGGINMLSLIKSGRFPFLTVVSMRGDFGEGNPWQFPMGQATQRVLEAMDVICLRAERPPDVIPAASAALTMAFKGGKAVALLLTQRLIGAKPF